MPTLTPQNDQETALNLPLWLSNKLMRIPLLSDLLLLVLWLLLWRVAALMEYAPHASIWFPPAGASFAAFLLLGLRAVPAIAIGSILVTFWESYLYHTGMSATQLLSIGSLFAIAHILPYYAGASILRMFIHSDEQKLPRLMLAFVIIGPLSSLSASYCIQISLMLGGAISANDSTNFLWIPLWVGDLIGVMVLTPLSIGLVSRIFPNSGVWLSEIGLRQSPGPNLPFFGKLLLAAFLSTLIMFTAAFFQVRELAFGIFFIGVVQMWIVYTETPLRSAVSIAFLSALTALLVQQLTLGDDALIYQFSISVLAASTYFGLLIPVLASNNERLQEIAHKDGLTKVLARQYFFQLAAQELQRARYYHQPICLVVFDIDHFKSINDTYGHTVGDLALKQLSQTVTSELGPADLLGRFGGDEFMLLLPGSDLEQAQKLLYLVREKVIALKLEQLDIQLKCSAGVTEILAEDTLLKAFERADCMLFEAKKQGRDKIVATI
ncbi:sensor domain-containing diguanylate cyclase [Shewanella avicenniae]|uniref:diguanylate cyclase n=1 Tax=Shewanella avicenniae TaxID=2814294 RepID=A0ABX7QR80_9GAMM|nr:diguanylate cyclase [Shewanella avicenniae]QSX33215.1 sensor domain-containing diguanylate cyclase [Shewanella avicenniae]